jgi:FKBP-type peptidyl-prolyl cis-trans isomerase
MSQKLTAVALIFAASIAGGRASDEKGQNFLAENKEKEGVVLESSGLQYKVLQFGEGEHHPLEDSPCAMNYKGTLIDGTPFDSGQV